MCLTRSARLRREERRTERDFQPQLVLGLGGLQRGFHERLWRFPTDSHDHGKRKQSRRGRLGEEKAEKAGQIQWREIVAAVKLPSRKPEVEEFDLKAASAALGTPLTVQAQHNAGDAFACRAGGTKSEPNRRGRRGNGLLELEGRPHCPWKTGRARWQVVLALFDLRPQPSAIGGLGPVWDLFDLSSSADWERVLVESASALVLGAGST
jgi:hypothetical protein